MSNDPEKVTFGATIEPTTASPATMPEEKAFQFPPRQDHLSTITEKDSQRSSDAQTPWQRASSDTMTPTTEHDQANPFSPFYEHPPARRSAEIPRSQLLSPDAARKNQVYFTESDVESGVGVPVSAATTRTNLTNMSKISIAHSKECSMWPSKQTLLEQRKAEKKKMRGRCDCWGRLTKKQRIIVQVLIALVVIGAAVGVGVGISRAVGGGVWAGTGQTKQVPQDDNGQ